MLMLIKNTFQNGSSRQGSPQGGGTVPRRKARQGAPWRARPPRPRTRLVARPPRPPATRPAPSSGIIHNDMILSSSLTISLEYILGLESSGVQVRPMGRSHAAWANTSIVCLFCKNTMKKKHGFRAYDCFFNATRLCFVS